MWRTKRRFAVGLGIIVLLASSVHVASSVITFDAANNGVSSISDAGISFRIRYTATILTMNSTMDKLQVYLPIPREWDSQTSVQIEEITPEPTSIEEDPDYGNKMAYFLLSDVSRSQILDFTIQYSFTFQETHIQVDPAKVGSYDASDPEYSKYTKHRPHDLVESDDQLIQKAASEIVGEETNPYLKAKLIYDWIVANVEYEFPSPWGAKETYLKRAGDCAKYTSLFCAMAISQEIPCRAVAGLLFWDPFPRTYSSKGKPTDPDVYGQHVYAEFYLPNYGWVPVDGSIGKGSGNPDRYFGDTWDTFLINSKGFGIWTVPPVGDEEMGKLLTFQHYWYWFWGEVNAFDDYYTYTVDRVGVTQTQTTAASATPSTTILESKTTVTTPTHTTLAETTTPQPTPGGQVPLELLSVAAIVIVAIVVAGLLYLRKRRTS